MFTWLTECDFERWLGWYAASMVSAEHRSLAHASARPDLGGVGRDERTAPALTRRRSSAAPRLALLAVLAVLAGWPDSPTLASETDEAAATRPSEPAECLYLSRERAERRAERRAALCAIAVRRCRICILLCRKS